MYGADYTARLTVEREDITYTLTNLHDRDFYCTENHETIIKEYGAIPHTIH